VNKFISDNEHQTLITDPTPKYQKILQKALLRNYLIINKKIRHLTQRKPPPPTLNALLNIHRGHTHKTSNKQDSTDVVHDSTNKGTHRTPQPIQHTQFHPIG